MSNIIGHLYDDPGISNKICTIGDQMKRIFFLMLIVSLGFSAYAISHFTPVSEREDILSKYHIIVTAVDSTGNIYANSRYSNASVYFDVPKYALDIDGYDATSFKICWNEQDTWSDSFYFNLQDSLSVVFLSHFYREVSSNTPELHYISLQVAYIPNEEKIPEHEPVTYYFKIYLTCNPDLILSDNTGRDLLPPNIISLYMSSINYFRRTPVIFINGCNFWDTFDPEDTANSSIVFEPLDIMAHDNFPIDNCHSFIPNGSNPTTAVDYFSFNYSCSTNQIEDNAAIFEQALSDIAGYYAEYYPTSIIEGFNVVGFSLGGLVGRYALAELEDQGLPTYTRTFISYDSPQRGAQLNLNLMTSQSIRFPLFSDFTVAKSQLHDLVRDMLKKDVLKQIVRSNPYADYDYQNGYSWGNPKINYFTPSREYLKFYGKLNEPDRLLENAKLPSEPITHLLNGNGYPHSQNNILNYGIANGITSVNTTHNNFLDTQTYGVAYGDLLGTHFQNTLNGEINKSDVDGYPGSKPGPISATLGGLPIFLGYDDGFHKVMHITDVIGGIHFWADAKIKLEYAPTIVPLYSSLGFRYEPYDQINDINDDNASNPTGYTRQTDFNEILIQSCAIAENHGDLNEGTKNWMWTKMYWRDDRHIGNISGSITCPTLGQVPLYARLFQPGVANVDWGIVPIDSSGHFCFNERNYEISNSLYELRIEGEGLATKIYHVSSSYQPNGDRVLAQVSYQMDIDTVCTHFLTVAPSGADYTTIQAAVNYAQTTIRENTQITVSLGTYAAFAINPQVSNQIIKIVGTTGSNNAMSTVQGALNANYLVSISGLNRNTIILEKIHFENAVCAIAEYEGLPKNIIVDHCLFLHQSDYSIFTCSPTIVKNSTFNLGNADLTPSAGAICTLGYSGITGLDLTLYPKNVIQNCIFTGNHYDHIVKIGYLMSDHETDGTRPLLSAEITGNSFITSAIHTQNSPTVCINCIQIASVKHVIIEDNIMYNTNDENTSGYNLCVFNPYDWNDPYTSNCLRIMSNTIWYANDANGNAQNNLSGIYLYECFDNTQIKNNVIANMEDYGIDSYSDLTSPDFNLKYNDIYHCTTNLGGIYTNNPFWAANHLISVDPKLNPATASLNPCMPKWDAAVRSPLIDSGDPNLTVHDLHPEQTSTAIVKDTDNTPLDIGAKPSIIAHIYENWSLPYSTSNSGWNWRGLPVMDILYVQGKTVNDVFNPANEAFSSIQYPGPNNIFNNNGVWSNPSYQLSRTMGYKVKCDASTNLPISGSRIAPYTTINLNSNQYINNGENWLSYWLPNSQNPVTALGSYASNITMIKTQYWTIAKRNGIWQMPARKVTLNYGDMVILKCTSDITGFTWHDHNALPPITPPKPVKIAYTEKEDYIPMFLDLTALQDSLPEEIGIMFGEECKGAVVVDSINVQLCAYITDLTEEEAASLTFVMEYGTKAPLRTCSSYSILAEDTKWITPKTSILNLDGVWLKIGGSSGATPPAILALHLYQNSPNPFSTQTVINYDLSQKGIVKINIYNIRGQLVKSYVNNADKSGKYQVAWDGKDKNKLACSSGIYFCCLESQGQRITKKMLLLK